MKRQSLDITDDDGSPVSNVFWLQDATTDHLAVILPGLQYTCDMPLLYYSVSHLLDVGADVLQVEYDYSRRADYATCSAAEQEQWLAGDVTAAWRAVISQRAYRRATLVGKSLGTRALRHLLATETLPDDTRLIWLTPLLSEVPVYDALRSADQPTLVIIGDADPHYDAATMTTLQAEVLVITGAEHGLEIAGDVVGSVRALEQAVVAVRRFTSVPGA